MQSFLAAMLWIPAAAASPTLFGIAGDSNGVPRDFSDVLLDTHTTTVIRSLGDGSFAFNGGLVYVPSAGAFYTIQNDSNISGTLETLSASGSLAQVGATGGLGLGNQGGLAFDTNDGFLYALRQDNAGNSILAQISLGGHVTGTSFGLGFGFLGGVAFDSANGEFYAIANDNSGASTLYTITITSSPPAISKVGALGYGFQALTYDPGGNRFYAAAPDINGAPSIYSIAPNGATTLLFGTQAPFSDLAVATPEPCSLWMAGFALLLLGGAVRFRTGGVSNE